MIHVEIVELNPLSVFSSIFRMGFLLNQGGHLHSHSHGHSHGPSLPSSSAGSGQQQRQHGSLAVRAAFIHALGDLLQSVGVLIAAYVVRFKVPILYYQTTGTFFFIFLHCCFFKDEMFTMSLLAVNGN